MSDIVRYRTVRAKEQQDKCFYCHLRMREDVTAEHLKAKSRNGGNSFSNIRAAHADCNSLVGNLDVEIKMELHYVGATYGSDEFFRLAAKYSSHRMLVSLKLRDRRQRDFQRLSKKEKHYLSIARAEARINARNGATAAPARNPVELVESNAQQVKERPGSVTPPGPVEHSLSFYGPIESLRQKTR